MAKVIKNWLEELVETYRIPSTKKNKKILTDKQVQIIKESQK